MEGKNGFIYKNYKNVQKINYTIFTPLNKELSLASGNIEKSYRWGFGKATRCGEVPFVRADIGGKVIAGQGFGCCKGGRTVAGGMSGTAGKPIVGA